MPFRGQEPRKENRDERFNRQLGGLHKDLQEYEKRKAFDIEGEQESFDRAIASWYAGEGPEPEVADPDSPFHGLPSGNVPMPPWMERPPIVPFDGIPREMMEPKNFPIQRILAPQYPGLLPPPPHSPQGPPQ